MKIETWRTGEEDEGQQ